jgi:hypothetical protein
LFTQALKDVIARFTVDSATEFLFGKDLCSLSAGLPYPSTSGRTAAHSDKDHPANKFAAAFGRAQDLTAKRSLFANAWPLMEFWRDKVAEQVATMDRFIEPLMKEAMAKKHEGKDTKGDVEDGTLLEHLVNSTDGMFHVVDSQYGVVLMLGTDLKVIRDEALNILLAGRDTVSFECIL